MKLESDAMPHGAPAGEATRALFSLPTAANGNTAAYLCGHSLGPAPLAASALVMGELARWSALGVRGHFEGPLPWVEVTAPLLAPLARLIGTGSDSVAVMNGLSVNLHLMLISFLQPRGERRCVLISRSSFPSDRLALVSQLRLHGLDPQACLLEAGPDAAAGLSQTDALVAAIEQAGQRLALVWVEAVDYCSGEVVDVARVCAAARRVGARVGFDLAHAIGNIPLALDAADADFAVWCSYKYLNGGPGAIGGCYVNRRFHGDDTLPRLAGWWGVDPAQRFRFEHGSPAAANASAWQLSNPPVLEAAALRAALALFDRCSLQSLRARSLALAAHARAALQSLGRRIEILTPAAPARHASQISLALPGRAHAIEQALLSHDVVCDARGPDILRFSLAALYNNEDDVAALLRALELSL